MGERVPEFPLSPWFRRSGPEPSWQCFPESREYIVFHHGCLGSGKLGVCCFAAAALPLSPPVGGPALASGVDRRCGKRGGSSRRDALRGGWRDPGSSATTTLALHALILRRPQGQRSLAGFGPSPGWVPACLPPWLGRLSDKESAAALQTKQQLYLGKRDGKAQVTVRCCTTECDFTAELLLLLDGGLGVGIMGGGCSSLLGRANALYVETCGPPPPQSSPSGNFS